LLINLLLAGRCISVNHEAQASIRIMPIVCCIGEAAGTAVGIAAKEGSVINQVNVKRVQEQLKNQNSIF
ncbi:FAD-dependent oxidoreductase, partial [Muricomes intestini]|uniref:FAD-dependent oxidoreductase n=1 Tax=Muricomes intestini TaxID=1796634 RepID=UPI002FDF03FC